MKLSLLDIFHNHCSLKKISQQIAPKLGVYRYNVISYSVFKFVFVNVVDDIITFPEFFHFMPWNCFSPSGRIAVKTNLKDGVVSS